MKTTLHLTGEELAEFDPLDFDEAELCFKRLRNVVVLRSGICLKNGFMVGTSIHRRSRLYPRFAMIAYGSWLKRPVAQADSAKTYITIHNVWSSGYFHWITESLARLEPVKELLPEATVLLPSHTEITGTMLRSLECFGVCDIELFPEESNVRVQNLILPETPLAASQRSVDFIRANVIAALGGGRGGRGGRPGPRKVYISRARSRGRQVINEDAVVALLAGRGYTRVFAEELSFAEQVMLMQGADIVVSPHGAGLTNIMFMRPGASVLELHRRVPGDENWHRARNSAKLSPDYPRLALRAGIHYYCQLCAAADLRQPVDVGDVIVDLSALEAKLRTIEDAG